MITSFHIQRYRTCRDVSIVGATHSTLLIGRNGAGKTNILSALEWVANMATDSTLPNIIPFLDRASFSLTLLLDGRTYSYSLHAKGVSKRQEQSFGLMYNDKLTEIGARGREKLIFERLDETITIADGRRRLTVSTPQSLVRTFDLALSIASNKKEYESIKSVHDFLKGVRYYALDNLRSKSYFIRLDQYASWLQKEDEDISDGDAVLYRLIRLHEERKEIFDEIVEILGSNELNIITDIKVGVSTPSNPPQFGLDGNSKKKITTDPINSFYSVHFFVPSAESSVVNYQGLSFGTKRILQLIVALLYDHSTVMLVEQPEDGIHPGLLGKLMRLIHSYASPTQFFMTSHSPSVVNSVPATDLRIVMNIKGATKCRPLTATELGDATKFINEEGQLAEFVRLLEQ